MRPGKTLAIFAVVSSIIIAACSKDDNNTPQSAEAMLTTNRWQLTAATATIPGSTITFDAYDTIPACIKDNFYTFAAGGSATVDEGASKCDPSDPQTTTGNWQLLNNNTQIKTIDPVTGQSTTLGIVALTSSKLILQDTVTLSGITVNGTLTLTNVK